MKTKPFLLATAGATVDGRTIDANMLKEMAEGYDPATYGARLNIEHIRGIGAQSPFRAYGDVVELSTAEVDVNFHGKTEKRLGLFGVFDVTDEAKDLNAQGQKVYPSVEIEPNFAGKGKAYLMGVALTDSPASIATDRLAFNRSLPGALSLKADKPEQAFALEFADASGATTPAGDTVLAKLGAMLDGFAAKFAGKPDDAAAAAAAAVAAKAGEGEPAALTFAALQPLFADITKTIGDQFAAIATAQAEAADAAELRFKALEAKFETTPSASYTARPRAAGANGGDSVTNC